MPHTCRFIDEALRSGGVVLVHGVHGLSRGATIMAAYCTIYVHPRPSLIGLNPCYISNVVPPRQCSRGYGHSQTKYGYVSNCLLRQT